MSAVLKEPRSVDAFIEHRGALRRHLHRRLFGRHKEAVEDLLQEVGICYWRRSIEPDNHLAYMLQIANHLLSNYFEEVRGRAFEVEDFGNAIEETAGTSMEDVTRRMDLETQVARMLAPIPANHRAVIILHKMYGYSYEDVAQELSLSIHTVAKGVTVAKQMLRSKRK